MNIKISDSVKRAEVLSFSG